VEKGDPKNFIPSAGIERIVTAFDGWQEEEKFAKIITQEQVTQEDYNISPSRYIHAEDTETYRPVREILEELETLEATAGPGASGAADWTDRSGLRSLPPGTAATTVARWWC
jgi:type I restriction-modification system DNA methylase subunit